MSPADKLPGSRRSEPLTIRSVDAVLVVVPMRRALGTSAMGIAEAPLVLIDLQTDEASPVVPTCSATSSRRATRRSP